MGGEQWGAEEARGDGAEDMVALSAITEHSSTRTGTEDEQGGTEGARAIAQSVVRTSGHGGKTSRAGGEGK